MSKFKAWCAGMAAAGLVAGWGPASAVEAGGSRVGRAVAVPGLAALDTGRDAAVTTVSCASAGSCAAGGVYSDRHGDLDQGFVVAERNGRWGTAIEVPGLGALNKGRDVAVDQVSCGSAGNCAAGGYYSGSRGQQGFVVAERDGRWGKAIQVPGLGALNRGGEAEVDSVSCGSAGSCVAGGYYAYAPDGKRGFVVAGRNGRWGKAIQVPGLGALNTGGDAEVESVSCGSAGNCAAGGYYTHGVNLDNEAFVASERNGRWGTAIEVPGLRILNKSGFAMVTSVSCASAGDCAAGGFYGGRDGNDQGFAVSERNGRWGTAIEVPGLGALNKHGDVVVNSVSCGTAGNCAVGGIYDERRDDQGNGFVAVERNGRWEKAIRVPGLAALNKGRGVTQVLTVSCASAGICAAGGYYFDRRDHHTWFTALERNGRWAPATQIPGLKTLNTGPDSVDISSDLSISCSPEGTCTAGAYYTGRSGHRGFVTNP